MKNGLHIRFLGQSGFELRTDTSTIIIDPSNKKSGDIEGDLVYCTHKHFDHISGVDVFLERNAQAKLVGNWQVIEKFTHWEDRTVEVSKGERLTDGPWSLEFIQNKHGIFKGIVNLGVIIRTEGLSFGHPGDAVYFKGFYNAALDMFATPISGGFASSPKRALSELTKFADPKPTIIPIHWLIRKPSSFCHDILKRFENVKCIVPSVGEMLG
ncbi:MAG: MBL fold metallo-hydrolase [Candidatus Thorarchaeota archaeon]